MTALAILTNRDRTFVQLATEVCNRHRNCLRKLHIKIVGEGAVLCGEAVSFYGKQIAFHEIGRRLQMKIIANRIKVLDGSNERVRM